MNICVLMTAAIEVRNKSLVQRNNTQVRLNDYKQMLTRWLTEQQSVSKIVFVECSGYPLRELEEIYKTKNPYGKQVEFISFISSGKANEDKSYGELMIDRYALDHSMLLKEATHFAHVGGRIFIKNFDSLITGLPDELHMSSIFMNNLANSKLDIFIAEKKFFESEIYPVLEKHIDEKKYMYYERTFSRAMHLALSKDYRWFPLCEEPVVLGVGGTKNGGFSASRIRSRYVNLISHLYDRFQRNSHGKNRKHLLDIWKLPPSNL